MATNYCTNCGTLLDENARFCTNCGEKTKTSESIESNLEQNIQKPKITVSHTEIEKINKKIALKNNQSGIVKGAWYSAGIFLLIIILAFMDLDFLPIHPAVVMISIFFLIMSLVVGFMFRSREKKLQALISGENLLAEWTLTDEQKKGYVNYLFKQEAGKNKIILFSIATIATIVFGIFILVIDEGKLAMFLVLIGLIAFLSMFAFGMPFYYKMKNSKGDGNILIGAKYAYINGYFHNWDFPLSGLSKVKIINEPFYGIYLAYYYTDRTLKHSEELFIPTNKDVDVEDLIIKLKSSN